MNGHRAVRSMLDMLLGDGESQPDPCRYYAVVGAGDTVDGLQCTLGYIRVGPDDIAAAVAHRLYPDVHFHLIVCDFPVDYMLAGNVGFLEGNHQ